MIRETLVKSQAEAMSFVMAYSIDIKLMTPSWVQLVRRQIEAEKQFKVQEWMDAFFEEYREMNRLPRKETLFKKIKRWLGNMVDSIVTAANQIAGNL